MTLKRILSLAAIVAMLPASGYAYKIETEEITFDETGHVVLKGNLDGAPDNTKILVTVMADGTKMSEVPEDNKKLAYTNEIFTDSNGEFVLKFKMNDKRVKTGRFSLNLFGENVDESVNKVFLYTTAADLEEINGVFQKDFTKEDISKLLNEYAENIKLIPFELFEKSNGENLLSNVYAEVKNQEISDLESFKELVWELSYVEAFNQGESELVVDSGYKLKKIEQLVLKDTGLFDVLSEEVNEEGRKTVIEALFGNDYKNYSEWHGALGEKMFVQRIVNSSSTGYAHVKEILGEDNLYGLDLSGYNDLSDTNKRKAESKLVSKKAATISELQSGLDEIIKDITKKKPSSGGGGGGGISAPSGLPYINSNGSNSDVTLHVIEKEENKEETEAVFYIDMENYEWAKEAVEALSQKGIVNGVGENEFSPESELTREQAVKILCLAAEIEKTDKLSDFSDVDNDAWYAEFVAMANNAGMVKGISEKEFGVGRKITRQDFAVMITRAFGLTESGNSEKFADCDVISDYARDSIGTLTEKGVITGYSNNTIKPTQNLTRAEAAVMIYRLISK